MVGAQQSKNCSEIKTECGEQPSLLGVEASGRELPLPEGGKYERLAHENTILKEQLRRLQQDLMELKNRTFSKLNLMRRGLELFRRHNESLRNEKQYLTEKLKSTQAQSNEGKRQTVMFERQLIALQGRVHELESHMNRSLGLAATVIQERDRTNAELRAQLNSAVQNFELSQKHVRLLRRQLNVGENVIWHNESFPKLAS